MPYVFETTWQAEEACRRIAPLVDFRLPADQIALTYRKTHNGDRLKNRLHTIYRQVQALPSPQELEAQADRLRDWVLETGDASNDVAPPLPL